MALVPSTMRELGTPAPDFTLPEPATGRTVGLSDFDGARALLVAFLSNHCPFVKHIADRFAAVAADYAQRGVAVVAINANDVAGYPADSPAKMKEEVAKRAYAFPYLFDDSQEVAKAYRAACTPDFFLFDGDRTLVYRGQFDASRPSLETPVTGADLCAAMDAVLAGRQPSADQVPSVGCNIKWKPGNEPGWQGMSVGNHGKELRKFNQDCTICHSCRLPHVRFRRTNTSGAPHRMAGVWLGGFGGTAISAGCGTSFRHFGEYTPRGIVESTISDLPGNHWKLCSRGLN